MASSMSNTGRPSRTGYTRRHPAHFRASGADLSSSGFLQAGQTRRSSKSWAIMTGKLYDGLNHFHHGVTETQRKEKT